MFIREFSPLRDLSSGEPHGSRMTDRTEINTGPTATELNLSDRIRTAVNVMERDRVPSLLNTVIADKYRITDVLPSRRTGEADLYVASDDSGNMFTVKLYRRKNAVKKEVLRKLSDIHSPYVAEISDFGTVEGFPYVVMPFYRGNSLDTIIRSGIRFSEEEIRTVILPPLSQAVKTVHDAGIIHKDIKPANMILSDDGKTLTLIDFGISSDTDGRTAVVTLTGNTPFYAAPETYTGLFLNESDYYSLGISLYEMTTGHIPFAGDASDRHEAARYAQIRKIPYPDDFPEKLKNLIDGLTYKDVSNRHDLNNPNRRWGHDEIEAWIRGESVPVPGNVTVMGKEIRDFATPYVFKGRKIYGKHELVMTLAGNWNGGIRELRRGNLERHFEINGMTAEAEKCRMTDGLMAEYDSTHTGRDTDLLYFELIYLLDGSVTGLYWKEFYFENLAEYGSALIKAVTAHPAPVQADYDTVHGLAAALRDGVTSSQTMSLLPSYVHDAGSEYTEAEIQLIATARTLIENDAIRFFVKNTDNPDRKALLELIPRMKRIMKTANDGTRVCELKHALRLGHLLSGSGNLHVGRLHFDDVSHLGKILTELREKDMTAYAALVRAVKRDTDGIKTFLGTGELEYFCGLLPPERDCYDPGYDGMTFRTGEEVLRYADAMWRNNDYAGFYEFTGLIGIAEANSGLPNAPAVADTELFRTVKKRRDAMIKTDDLYYLNEADFTDAVNSLKSDPAKFNGYYEKHKASLKKLYLDGMKTGRTSLSDFLADSFGFGNTTVNGFVELGRTVEFGRYYQGGTVENVMYVLRKAAGKIHTLNVFTAGLFRDSLNSILLTPTRRTPPGRMYSGFADFCIRTQNISPENRVGIFILGIMSGVSEIILVWMLLLILVIAVITSVITMLCVPRIMLWLTAIIMKLVRSGGKLSWIVVEKNEKEAVLLTEKAVDAPVFSSSKAEWKDSDVRRWCNGTFYAKAFGPEEKREIIPTSHSDTVDTVFLPSHAEYVKYVNNVRLTERDISTALPTRHVRRLTGSPAGNPVPWLLRSTAPDGTVECVSADGTVEIPSSKSETPLRPAVRIIL